MAAEAERRRAQRQSRQSAEVIANTSRLAWLMLTLRANYADDSVDSRRTNLKAGTPSTGLAMNLSRVDFSGRRAGRRRLAQLESYRRVI